MHAARDAVCAACLGLVLAAEPAPAQAPRPVESAVHDRTPAPVDRARRVNRETAPTPTP